MTTWCQVCGHEEHEPGACGYSTVAKGCCCGSCSVSCRCDRSEWFLQELDYKPETEPKTAPDPEWLKFRDSICED